MLESTVIIVNMVLVISWLVLILSIIISLIGLLCGMNEPKIFSAILGVFAVVCVFASVVQLILVTVSLFYGGGLVEYIMPFGCIVFSLGMIFQNNPRHIGQFLCECGVPLMIIGILVATGYSFVEGFQVLTEIM